MIKTGNWKVINILSILKNPSLRDTLLLANSSHYSLAIEDDSSDSMVEHAKDDKSC
ncbi:hypothetical protein OROMI_009334 [Orobanche minor]